MSRPGKGPRAASSAIVLHTLLVLGALIMAGPFLWMILTSLKTFAETTRIPMAWLPAKINYQNYIDVLQKMSFLRFFANTLIVTVSLTVGQILICSLAAYAFARLDFPGRGFLFFLVLSILMIPAQMTLIPRFLITNKLGWINTFWGLIIPSLPSAYGTFFLVQFLKTVPTEVEDAGKIDGCSIPRLYWNIAMPMCTNGIIALGIIVVLWSWNELLWPLVVTNSEKLSVLAIGLASLLSSPTYYVRYNLLMAAAVLITAPMLIVFVVGQKKFIAGIAISGLKA
jgi:multiple sugar transport system permease protein